MLSILCSPRPFLSEIRVVEAWAMIFPPRVNCRVETSPFETLAVQAVHPQHRPFILQYVSVLFILHLPIQLLPALLHPAHDLEVAGAGAAHFQIHNVRSKMFVSDSYTPFTMPGVLAEPVCFFVLFVFV
jgi:hypothetical protein